MMDFDYTVKVYADAIEIGGRALESIPEKYRKAVEHELSQRTYKLKQLKKLYSDSSNVL